jgi:gliding motility-associated protein GldM
MAMPKDPRSAMIQMMYLVLTAMLALNITKEVLNAFGTINGSIERSNTAITDKNAKVYDAFNDLESQEDMKDKVKDLNGLAKEVKAETENLYNYLQSWKDSVIVASGGLVPDDNGGMKIKNIENIDASPEIFIKRKKGEEVRQYLNNFKTKLIELVKNPNAKASEAEIANITANLPINTDDYKKSEDNPTGDWVHGTFNNIPVVAAISIFSKFQNDVKNSESMVLELLSSKIGIDDYKFDKLEPIAVVNQGYALEGQELEAKVLLAAYNSTVNPNITSSAGAVKVENGVGTLKFKASGVGERTVNGTISLTKGGKLESYPYSFKYTVGQAGGSLQLDKMNVMYIGVDNPVTISASGYNIGDVNLVVPTGVTAKRGQGGAYLVNVTTPGEFTYNITAKRGSTGGNIASGKIRVKRIPDPRVTLMKKLDGPFPANQIKVQRGLSAELEDFVFDAKFQVVSFDLLIVPRNADVITLKNTGAAFEPKISEALKSVKAGDQVIFSNIRAKGPDGTIRKTNGLSFSII